MKKYWNAGVNLFRSRQDDSFLRRGDSERNKRQRSQNKRDLNDAAAKSQKLTVEEMGHRLLFFPKFHFLPSLRCFGDMSKSNLDECARLVFLISSSDYQKSFLTQYLYHLLKEQVVSAFDI